MPRPGSNKPRKGSGTSFGKRTDAEKSFRKRTSSSRSEEGPKRSFSKPSGYKSSGSSFRASGKPSFGRPDSNRSEGDERSSRSFEKPSGFSKPYRAGGGDEKRPFRKPGSSFGGGKSYGSDSEGKRPFRKNDAEGDAKRPARFEKSDDRKGGFKKDFSKRPDSYGDRKDFRKRDEEGAGEKRESRGGDFKKPYRKAGDSEKPRDFRSIQDKKSFGKEERKSFVQSRVTTISDFTKPGRKSEATKESAKKEETKNDDGLTRLNKYIANSGVGSRREADKLITMGLISVNGITITELGTKVKAGDVIRYEDKVLKAEKPVYILLNKPKGFITTTDDPQDRNTVMNLVAGACKERIYPVGRLDRNTTGLLLLTNDGDLADKLTHPSYKAKKVYKVELDKPLTKNDFQKIVDGVHMEEGRAMVDDLAIISEDNKTIGLEIHIGWNRVVRRIFETLGYDVVKLDRSVYAGLDKKDTPRGHWRFLKAEEIVALKHFK